MQVKYIRYPEYSINEQDGGKRSATRERSSSREVVC